MASLDRIARGAGEVKQACLLMISAVLLTCAAQATEPIQVSQQALDLHRDSLVFDTHNNLIASLLRRKDVDVATIDLTRFQQGLQTDIPRLQQGGLGAEFFASYVSSASIKKGMGVRETLEQIDRIKQLIRRYPDVWELAGSSDDVLRLRREHKLAGLIAIENGDAIDGSLAILRSYHEAGVRCMALTHDDTHSWADAALDKPKHQGLSEFGKEVIVEMNRLGMVIDLSHASEETIRDTLAISRAPVIFSHSGVQGVAPHPRNLSDDMLRQVAKNGGVIQVNFFAGFLTAKNVAAYKQRSQSAYELRKTFRTEEQFQLALQQWLKEHPLPTTTVADVVDHIAHIITVAGIDHVGLGSNFDGITSTPRDLCDVSCFPMLTQEMLNRGYTSDQIRKVLGENTLRVLRQVEQVAKSNSSPMPPTVLTSRNPGNQ